MDKIKWLKCTCCGEQFRGRQFKNQDTGYGLGECCVEYVRARTTNDMELTYGKPGIHYKVREQP